jgi:hypothetical protein
MVCHGLLASALRRESSGTGDGADDLSRVVGFAISHLA